MSKKWLIYNKPKVLSGKEEYKYGDYRFTFDRKGNPIPVLVDSEMAKFLLALTEKPRGCHHTKSPKKLFKEVFII